jgi:hypothetical protein
VVAKLERFIKFIIHVYFEGIIVYEFVFLRDPKKPGVNNVGTNFKK